LKYSKEITEEICEHLRKGATQKDAGIMCNITETTFQRWMNDNSAFNLSVKKALTEFKLSMVDIIEKASIKHWTAAAWMLERRWKADYALSMHFGGDLNVKTEQPLFGPIKHKKKELQTAKN